VSAPIGRRFAEILTVDWRALRQLRGLSLRETCRLADVIPSCLSRIESGERQASPETFLRLSLALGLREAIAELALATMVATPLRDHRRTRTRRGPDE
jgi:transcriptional regulator with XRE-family HTH domain